MCTAMWRSAQISEWLQVPSVCLILSNQRFSALGMNMHVKSLGRSMALPACSAAVVLLLLDGSQVLVVDDVPVVQGRG